MKLTSLFFSALLELSELKRCGSNKQRELSEYEIELDKLKSRNRQLKASLMRAMIEKEELEIKKNSLRDNIERLERQIENLDRECDCVLNNDTLIQFFDRHSTANQLALINRIQDGKCRLIQYSS